MSVKNEYYIFSNDLYDEIKMCFSVKTIENLKRLWLEGKSALQIAGKLKLTELEIFLLISDLQITGLLPERDSDFYGRKIR